MYSVNIAWIEELSSVRLSRWYLVFLRTNNTLEVVRIPDEEPQPKIYVRNDAKIILVKI